MGVKVTLGVLVLACGLLLGEVAGQPEKKKVRKISNRTLVEDLTATLRIMAKANHNYKGHRIKAMNHVRDAVKYLDKDAGGKLPTPKVGDGKGRESQKLSDAQLRTALGSLRTTLQEMKTLKMTKQRKMAAQSIRDAIGELELALKVA